MSGHSDAGPNRDKGKTDPDETLEQRMDREIRQIKDEYARKSMKLATNLLRLKHLAMSLDRDEILAAIVESVAKGLDAPRVQVLLLDRQKEFLRPVRAEGMAARELSGIAVPIGEPSLLAFLVENSQARESRDAGAFGVKECRADPRLAGLVDRGVLKTLIAAPILVDGELFGVINVETMTNPDYATDDLNLVSFCADIAGQAFTNARLYAASLAAAAESRAALAEQEKKTQALEQSLSRFVKDLEMLKMKGSKEQVDRETIDLPGRAGIDLPTDIGAEPPPECLKQNFRADGQTPAIICANCGTGNDSQMKFCQRCGTPIF